MKNYVIENCKKCNQQLRIPLDIGGMVLRCPNCGNEFHTDFKMAGNKSKKRDSKKRATKRPASTFKVVV